MRGVYKENLRSFDETTKECSDIVLVVNGEEFYSFKLYLASQSNYFKAMFLGMFDESAMTEITLTGIAADDFQNYLEVLYGHDSVDETTVEGILLIADMYDTPLAIGKCKKFLMKESKKTLKKKLEMSVRYRLDELKKKCLSKIKNANDIRNVVPANIRDLDPSLMADFLEKALASNLS